MKKKSDLEAALEQRCVDRVEAVGGRSAKLDKIRRSDPDRAFFLPGGVTWIVEFKLSGEEPRPDQQEVLDEFEALGFEVDVICDEASFIRKLAHLCPFNLRVLPYVLAAAEIRRKKRR